LVALGLGASLTAVISITFLVGQQAAGLALHVTRVQVLVISIWMGLTLSICVALILQFPSQYFGVAIAWCVIVLISVVVWIIWQSPPRRVPAQATPGARLNRESSRVLDQVIRAFWIGSLVGTIVFVAVAAIAIGLAHLSGWVALAPLVSLLVFAYYSLLLIYRRK
jgi:hypothetical protein